MTPKKTVAKKTVARVEKPEYQYSVEMELNDKVISFETNNLRDGIFEHRPDVLKTRVIFNIKDNFNGTSCEKMVFLIPAKMMFLRKFNLEVFTHRLLFK